MISCRNLDHSPNLSHQLSDHGRNTWLALSAVCGLALHQVEGGIKVSGMCVDRREHDREHAAVSNKHHMALPAKLGRTMRAPLSLSALDKVTPSGRPAKVVRWGF
ncbi:hypothetical protein ACT6QG_05420 [Xanthobacter sp. TB0136]|uniref:hypothetical protein n=1 Tax=Xanthobacter sp. TB0136 TaxID=3459177 RepID=UPI00403A1727